MTEREAEIIRMYEDALAGRDMDGLERANRLMYESGDPNGVFNDFLRTHDTPVMRAIQDDILGRELEDASLESLGGVIPREGGDEEV
jgi:hypothetical protein